MTDNINKDTILKVLSSNVDVEAAYEVLKRLYREDFMSELTAPARPTVPPLPAPVRHIDRVHGPNEARFKLLRFLVIENEPRSIEAIARVLYGAKNLQKYLGSARSCANALVRSGELKRVGEDYALTTKGAKTFADLTIPTKK